MSAGDAQARVQAAIDHLVASGDEAGLQVAVLARQQPPVGPPPPPPEPGSPVDRVVADTWPPRARAGTRREE